jgi:hypothetical protein
LIGSPFSLESPTEIRAAEASTKRRAGVGRSQRDVVFVAPEIHFIARLDAELVAQVLWDHYLALRSDTVSHTGEYNLF